MTSDGPGARSPELGKLMASEMDEQPARLAALLSRREEIAKDIRSVIPARLEGTVLVARGSSDHAATYGAYVLEMATGRPVALSSPSVLTLYRHNTDYSGHLVVAVSQSGQTPEIVEVLRRARECGARTVAVTNDPASPLAHAADLPVLLGAGQELAVPATKTVTTQFTAFSIIAQSLGEIGLSDEVADVLPRQVAEVLADPGPPAALAAWLADADRLVTLARGLLLGAAREAALKIAETTSMLTTGYSSADLRHGPIAIASRKPPFVAFAHPGPASPDVLGAVNELRARGASVALVGPVEGNDMAWPLAAPEILAPVLAVVRGQQLALSLARLLGRDPDAPPGLSKVTPT